MTVLGKHESKITVVHMVQVPVSGKLSVPAPVPVIVIGSIGLGLGLVAVPHQNTDLHNSRHTSYESSRHGLSRYNRLRLDRLVGAEISVFEHL